MVVKSMLKGTLENGGIAYLPSKVSSYEDVFRLEAEYGHLITDGTNTYTSVIVPASEVDNYYEIEE